jgi:hypothetical protein
MLFQKLALFEKGKEKTGLYSKKYLTEVNKGEFVKLFSG